MATLVEVRQRIHDRIYGDIIERWRARTLDDRAFERAYRVRAQLIIQPVFLLLMAVTAIGDWVSRDISIAEHLNRLPMFPILFGTFGLAIGLRMDGFMRFGAHDLVLRRNRNAAEQKQQVTTTSGKAISNAALGFGSFARTARYGNWVLIRTCGATALVALGAVWYERLELFLFILGPLMLWALFARFDRRPYVDISPEGVWCRAWGKQRLPFSDFKAVYQRQRKSGHLGVVLVPHTPTALAAKLSWHGRYTLRSGENVPAHAGTLTLWTSAVGLNRDRTLRGLQAEIGKAQGQRAT